MNKRLFFILGLIVVTIFININVFATAQKGDRIIYKGDTFRLYSNPLEQFLYGKENLREKIPIRHHSTACWRGYVALWIIEDSTLYLKGFIGDRYESNKDTFSFDLIPIFGNKVINGKVKADWFTGTLLIPNGKLIEYIHMGYASKYERESIFTIENGKVTEIRNIENEVKKVPEGYQRSNLFYFYVDIPIVMYEKYKSKESRKYKVKFSFSNINKKFTLNGKAYTNKVRMVNISERNNYINKKINNLMLKIDKKNSITKISEKQGNISLANYKYIDGKDKDGNYYRIAVFSNVNTYIEFVFKTKEYTEDIFIRIADNILNSMNILEFGI